MDNEYSGKEFVAALVSNRLKPSLRIRGMVQQSDDVTVLKFSPGSGCERWIDIPLDMVKKVIHLGEVPCKDHTHHQVVLHLLQPIQEDNPTAAVFAAILTGVAGRMGVMTPEAASPLRLGTLRLPLDNVCGPGRRLVYDWNTGLGSCVDDSGGGHGGGGSHGGQGEHEGSGGEGGGGYVPPPQRTESNRRCHDILRKKCRGRPVEDCLDLLEFCD